MSARRRIEEWNGVVIRAIEHRREYAADKVFKDKATAQWEASLLDNLQAINEWIKADQKVDEQANARNTAIEGLITEIRGYNSSIEGEFGKNSEACKTHPRLVTRIEEWNGVVIRAIEHRREYAANKVFKNKTTEQWEASLLGHLQTIKDWIEADQKAREKAGARDTGIEAIRIEISEYNKSIEGEFGRKSEAFITRVRVGRPEPSRGSRTKGTKVDPSK